MTRVGWLADASEDELRSALVACAPDLAGLPMRIKLRDASSDPLWWSSSAVIDEAVVVKFAWSEVRAVRLWREGVILERLRRADPTLPLPEVVVLAEQPALVATRVVQADTARLRRRFPALVDHERGRWVLGWCDWVDGVLGRGAAPAPVMVHGDLHGSMMRAPIDGQASMTSPLAPRRTERASSLGCTAGGERSEPGCGAPIAPVARACPTLCRGRDRRPAAIPPRPRGRGP